MSARPHPAAKCRGVRPPGSRRFGSEGGSARCNSQSTSSAKPLQHACENVSNGPVRGATGEGCASTLRAGKRASERRVKKNTCARLWSRAAPRAVAREGRGRALRDRSSRDRPRPELSTRIEARRPTRSRRARRRVRGDRASRRISPLHLPSASAWATVAARGEEPGPRTNARVEGIRRGDASRLAGERGTARGSKRRALALGVWRDPARRDGEKRSRR